ncbi:MAG: transposase [Candidatus Spechtbacteria bacterium]|nr:transposase [Candidatus Spechtbacteria bacterium]
MKTREYVGTFFSKPYLFRRLTTLSLEEFEILREKLEPAWKESERKRLSARKDRKRKVGQGRPYELGNFKNLLFITVIYLRTNASVELLSLLMRVDKDAIRRPVTRILPLIQDRFIPDTPLLRKRINTLDELLKDFPELKDAIFDGSEFPIQRPKHRQKQSYSGKKKRHTKKSVIALDKKTKLIIGVSPPRRGNIHDKKQLEKTAWDKQLPTSVGRYGDLGYYGMRGWHLPYKKPKGGILTRWQKTLNKRFAKERIAVEHGIRGIKIFRRVGEIITIKSDELFSTTLLAAANLSNFKRLMRQGLG